MKLFRYTEWITESKLELLLEANMDFSEEFLEIVDKVKSPLSEKILRLYKTDIDVDTNYIELSDKENFLKFKSDKRVETNCIIEQPNYIEKKESKRIFPSFTSIYVNDDNFNIKDWMGIDQPARIVSELKVDDERLSKSIKSSIERGRTFYHIKWSFNGKEYDSIIRDFGIRKGPEYVKPQEVRVGSLIQSLLKKSGEEFTAPELEDFVIKFNSEVKSRRENIFKNFEIVKGEDIREYYLSKNYESSNHTLGGSCMRYSRCQPYLDIYVKNPNQVSMVILRSDEDSDKIKGRALLWNPKYDQDDYDGKLFMDRIYTNNSQDEELFKRFAIEKGWVYKKDQNYSKQDFMFSEVLTSIKTIEVKLESDNFDQYPYIDTLTYYVPWHKRLSNINTYEGYSLEETDGSNGQGCSTCEGEDYIDCYECGGSGTRTCFKCDGDGEVDCDECGGMGKEECSTCDGTGLDSEDNECSNCSGSGEMNCTECEGRGKENCSRCDSDGEYECGECGGNGRVICPDCQ